MRSNVRVVRPSGREQVRVSAARGRVLVLSATVGQGHEGAARELARRLRLWGIEAEVRDFLDAVPAPVRWVLRDGYGPTVRYAPGLFDRWFRALERDGVVSRAAERLCRLAEPAVLRWSRGADVVVSTYPLAGRTAGRLRRRGLLAGPAVTFLTDPAAHRLWCHPDVDAHLTVTAATAADGARYGVDLRPAGALCAPRFSWRPPAGSRGRVRARLDIPPAAPMVLLGSGSLGMGDVRRTVDAVLHHERAWVAVLCGRNDLLRRRLAGRSRVVALGWRDDVPELMAAADVLVHNAGGLSFTEALVAGLPAVTYLPIPGHGRANAELLARAGLAPWPRDPAALVAVLDDALARGRPAPAHRPAAGTADPAAVVAAMVARRRGADLLGRSASAS